MKHPSDINVHRQIKHIQSGKQMVIIYSKNRQQNTRIIPFFCPSYSANEEVCVFPHMEIPEVCSNGAPPQ